MRSGQSVANTDLTGLQPRIGGASQLNDKVVLRGGWGRYFLNPNNDGFRNEGYSVTTSLIASNNGGRTPINQLLSNPFPSILVPAGANNGLASLAGQGFDFFDPTFKLAHIDQFSFSVQYQLPWQSRLEVSYNGNRASKLQTARQYNEPSLAFRQSCNLYEGGNPLFCDQLVNNPFYNLPQFAGTNLGTSQTISRFQLARPFPEFGAINQRGRNDGKRPGGTERDVRLYVFESDRTGRLRRHERQQWQRQWLQWQQRQSGIQRPAALCSGA